MITPAQVVTQLQTCLPLLTDRFHDVLPVTSGSVSSGILTITLPTGHGITAGQKIFIPSALIRNEITAVFVDPGDDSVRYTTAAEHDLTAFMSERPGRQYPEGLTVILEIAAAQVVVTLDETAAAVPAKDMFEAPDGAPTFVPDGTQFLLENRSVGIVGQKVVDTAGATTITIDLSDVPSIPDGPVIMTNILTSVRIAMVADIERAQEVYTKQAVPKAFLFVIMLDITPSKDRDNNDDFVGLPGSSFRISNLMQEFSTVVILPTDNDLGGGDTKAFAYSDLLIILIRCLYGWQETAFNGAGQSSYNTAAYSHAYDWQSRQQINFTDGFENTTNVALREIVTEQTIFDAGDSDANIEYP